MLWINTIVIIVSAYVFAYGAMRTFAFLMPRIVQKKPAILPLGAAASISLIGFCIVTGTPGPVILAMILTAFTQARYALIGTSPRMHQLALVVAGALIGSVLLTQNSLQIENVSPYIPAVIVAVAAIAALMLIHNTEALRMPLLLAISAISLAAPIAGLPYHIALDGTLVLACIAAFMLVSRHVRLPATLDGAFTLPAAIISLHSVMIAAMTLAKGL